MERRICGAGRALPIFIPLHSSHHFRNRFLKITARVILNICVLSVRPVCFLFCCFGNRMLMWDLEVLVFSSPCCKNVLLRDNEKKGQKLIFPTLILRQYLETWSKLPKRSKFTKVLMLNNCQLTGYPTLIAFIGSNVLKPGELMLHSHGIRQMVESRRRDAPCERHGKKTNSPMEWRDGKTKHAWRCVSGDVLQRMEWNIFDEIISWSLLHYYYVTFLVMYVVVKCSFFLYFLWQT